MGAGVKPRCHDCVKAPELSEELGEAWVLPPEALLPGACPLTALSSPGGFHGDSTRACLAGGTLLSFHQGPSLSQGLSTEKQVSPLPLIRRLWTKGACKRPVMSLHSQGPKAPRVRRLRQ